MKKRKMLMEAHNNGLGHCSDVKELEDLCPLEVMVVSQVVPFMFIVGRMKGEQLGLSGQCVVVPADLKKIQTILPRNTMMRILLVYH